MQGITACAGSAASGQGDCASAAIGASASVVVNTLLTSLEGGNSITLDPNDPDANKRSLEEQQARVNLVTTIIAGIAAGAGLDAASAAQVETENNGIKKDDDTVVIGLEPTLGRYSFLDLAEGDQALRDAIDEARIGDESDAELAERYNEYLECRASTTVNCQDNPGFENLIVIYNAAIATEDNRLDKLFVEDVNFLESIGIEVGTDNDGEKLSREEVRALAAKHRYQQAYGEAVVEQLRITAIQLETEYDGINGEGSYKKKLEQDLRDALAQEDEIKAAVARAKLPTDYVTTIVIKDGGEIIPAPANDLQISKVRLP